MSGKDLRIVFMGTPEFAVGSLKALVENGYNVVGVVTAPDRPSGRGQKLHQSDVKQYATSCGLPVLQPEKLKDENFLHMLKFLNPDIQIIVAFRMLPEVVWNMPTMGTINLHGSLLPNYRGAAPLNWAIINGDQETGVTTFLLKQTIDTGNILFQAKVKIGPEETIGELHDALMVIGAKLVLKTVDSLADGAIIPLPQNIMPIDPDRLHAPKISRESCMIDWGNPGINIYNLIRGLSPYPAAWTTFHGSGAQTGIKIFKASIEQVSHQCKPGEILSDNKKFLKIACADGFLHILDLQLAGKNRMGIAEFLRGFPNVLNYKAL
ncbi:MAG: methionyl-tRNA formyltransferase [Bacteroidia bacterium]|nr:methionyl-tRNA formyltransferase [Bacteroidia bacterium]